MRSYYHNPYYSCYPKRKFGYFHFYKKAQDPNIEKELLRFWEIMDKAYTYAYGYSIKETQDKILNYLKIGEIDCADKLSDQINDVFYFMNYINHIIWGKALYNTPPCKQQAFIKCLKQYWYCKRINIASIIKEFELEVCKETGVDYMVIIDPFVNPSAVPPNEVK
ncbi:MAG: hypothetical protein RML94_00065 [Bacteroidia bacterium]|nr:hypothetical protein [Bacteroidia bacterium]